MREFLIYPFCLEASMATSLPLNHRDYFIYFADDHVLYLRHYMSLLLRTLVVVYGCVGITNDTVEWYIKHLQGKGKGKKESSLKVPALYCSYFQKMCVILWMFNVRDELSLATRKYLAAKEKGMHLQNMYENLSVY